MRSVTVLYHLDDGTWWADSPDLPGWTCAGRTFEETRRLAFEGVHEFLDEAATISEVLPEREAG